MKYKIGDMVKIIPKDEPRGWYPEFLIDADNKNWIFKLIFDEYGHIHLKTDVPTVDSYWSLAKYSINIELSLYELPEELFKI
jgi:hypothetical protein